MSEMVMGSATENRMPSALTPVVPARPTVVDTKGGDETRNHADGN